MAGMNFRAKELECVRVPDLSAVKPYNLNIIRVKSIISWKIICAYHLTGEQNGGQNNTFISALDAAGNRVYDPRIIINWSWDGRNEATQPARSFPLDKPEPWAMGDIGMGAGQIVELKVGSTSTGNLAYPSDIIKGLHTGWDSDSPGNHRFHHSFFIVFQYTTGSLPPDPTPTPKPEPRTYNINDDLYEITLTIKPK